MSKTKLLILLLIIVAVIVAIIFAFVKTQPRAIVLHFCILNNDYISRTRTRIVKDLGEVLDSIKPVEITMRIISGDNPERLDTTFKRKPGQSYKVWKEEISKNISEFLVDTPKKVFENAKINDLFLKFVDEVRIKGRDPSNIFVFTGTFPECYDVKHSLDLVDKIKELSGRKNLNKKEKSQIAGRLIWQIIDPREAEKLVLDSMLAYTDINITNLRVQIQQSRSCEDEDLPMIFGIFFDKLSPDQAYEFYADFVKSELNAGKFLLTILNDGPKLDSRVKYLGVDLSDSVILVNTLNSLNKCEWTSINYLFKHALNLFKNKSPNVIKHFVIVGNFPKFQPINILDRKFWDELKRVPNLRVYHFVPSGTVLTYDTKRIIQGIEKAFKPEIILVKVYHKGG